MREQTKMTAEDAPAPPCPYCGEHQSHGEARPSKPRVIKYMDWTPKRGGYLKRETVYDTSCRACGEQIIWGFCYSNGSFGQLDRLEVYHWSKH